MNISADKITATKTTPVYTLSVTSQLSGIPIHSIRQYIDKGLIIPYKKNSSRHLFSDIDITRLKNIRNQLEVKGLNIAGIKSLSALIPCWAIRSCSMDERSECDAYNSITQPCWEASEKGSECRNINCRECEVYCILEEIDDLKVLIKQYIK